MSDDSFIREVDEELRQDQIKGIWSQYGRVLIGVAVAIVVGTAGYRGYEYWQQTQAAASGDAFLKAAELSEAGNQDEAIKALGELVKTGTGEYPALAQFRIAGEMLGRGDKPAALAAFDAIIKDSGFDAALRNVAAIRAGLIAVDVETYDQVKTRVESLAGSGEAFRSLAREILGLSAFKAGNDADALKWFQQIADDAGSTNSARERAGLMLQLLAGKGVVAKG
jgi:hypothetical protein